MNATCQYANFEVSQENGQRIPVQKGQECGKPAVREYASGDFRMAFCEEHENARRLMFAATGQPTLD